MEYDNSTLYSRIEYPVTEWNSLPPAPEEPRRESRFWVVLRRQFLVAALLCALVLTMNYWWPQGVQAAREYLICQEIGPVEEAAQVFVRQLAQGEPMEQAVTAFCKEVLDASAD